MTSSPEISVVIPVYNGASYIQRSVRSALSQEGVEHEVIVVDDGSADGSGDLAAAVDPKVRVVRTSNRGLSAARNRGIKEARGQIVALLDSDDWWVADKLSAQNRLFSQRKDIDVVFCDFCGVDQAGHPDGWLGGLTTQLVERGMNLEKVGTDEFLLSGPITHALIRHTSFIHPSTIAIRRDLLLSLGGFDESITHAEDLEMWLRLSQAGRFGYIGRILVTTESRPNSLGRLFTRLDEHLLGLYQTLPSRFPDLPPDLQRHIADVVLTKRLALGWHYRRAGDHRKARLHYREALKTKPRLKTLIALLRTYIPILRD